MIAGADGIFPLRDAGKGKKYPGQGKIRGDMIVQPVGGAMVDTTSPQVFAQNVCHG